MVEVAAKTVRMAMAAGMGAWPRGWRAMGAAKRVANWTETALAILDEGNREMGDGRREAGDAVQAVAVLAAAVAMWAMGVAVMVVAVWAMGRV